MAETKIEWTHQPGTVGRTWNPVLGCTKVSLGCDHCYALTMSHRLQNAAAYQGLTRMWSPTGRPGVDWTGEVRCLPERLEEPLHWKASTVFVCSMSDLFHDKVPWEFILKVFNIMACTEHHTYQVLTKRPGRMAYFAEKIWPKQGGRWEPVRPIVDNKWPGTAWPANVWAGTSVESQKYAPRLKCLARVPATVRFASVEPMLAPVNLTRWLGAGSQCEADRVLDWVICGGESGPGARPMHPQWPRDLAAQCLAAGVPFFFKQWGAWVSVSNLAKADFDHKVFTSIVTEDGIQVSKWPESYQRDRPRVMARVGKKAAGALLDGREWREWPL